MQVRFALVNSATPKVSEIFAFFIMDVGRTGPNEFVKRTIKKRRSRRVVWVAFKPSHKDRTKENVQSMEQVCRQ